MQALDPVTYIQRLDMETESSDSSIDLSTSTPEVPPEKPTTESSKDRER